MTLRVSPPAGFLDVTFNFGNGAAVIVTPSVQIAVVQGNPILGNLLDGDRTFRLVGCAVKQDPVALVTGATFTIQFASGINTVTAPWGAVTGTMPNLAAGQSGRESSDLDWILPDVLRDNHCWAVTLATAPANAVSIQLTIVLEYV